MTDPSTSGPKNGAPAAGGLIPEGKITSQRCTAHTSSGKPCKRWAIVGGTVCPTHGGSAPQVREAARKRLLSMVPTALAALQAVAEHGESEAARVSAARDILDRAGLKPADILAVAAAQPSEEAAPLLDAAIAEALRARGLMPASGGQAGDEDDEDIVDAEVLEDSTQGHTQPGA